MDKAVKVVGAEVTVSSSGPEGTEPTGAAWCGRLNSCARRHGDQGESLLSSFLDIKRPVITSKVTLSAKPIPSQKKKSPQLFMTLTAFYIRPGLG